MIGLRLTPSSPPAARYVLDTLLEGMGVPATHRGEDMDLPVVLSYGPKEPRTGKGIVVHVPEGGATWAGFTTPEYRMVSDQHSGFQVIHFVEDFIPKVFDCLTGKAQRDQFSYWHSVGGEDQTFIPPVLSRIRQALAGALRTAFHRQGLPWITISPWPEGRPFALLLSHDVDHVHGRELFRILSHINHLRNTLMGKAPGELKHGLRRIARAILSPKPLLSDFTAIRQIEGGHGWSSTLFFLEDRYWARYGGRYRLNDPGVLRLLAYLKAEGCEAAVHGGYYAFNSAEAYHGAARKLAAAWDGPITGIRNHWLRWTYPQTWRAQEDAGFLYDSTFGYQNAPGFRAGYAFPFHPFDCTSDRPLQLLELPLTLMDITLFHYLRFDLAAAIAHAGAIARATATEGGLLCLLWHNNYFNEPEYRSYEETYRQLLSETSSLRPWCATGREIAMWWNGRAGVHWETLQMDDSGWVGKLSARDPIINLQVRVEFSAGDGKLEVEGTTAQMREQGASLLIDFPRLDAGNEVVFKTFHAPSGETR